MTTDGHAIMCSKLENILKPKFPTSWACVSARKLPKERWGMAAMSISCESLVLDPRVPIFQRPLDDLLQTMLPTQTAVNTKPWQTKSPSRDIFYDFFKYLLLTTESTWNLSVLPRQASGELSDQIPSASDEAPKFTCICTKRIFFSPANS